MVLSLSLVTTPTPHMVSHQYPPGVLTGRPLEDFKINDTLEFVAVPEQWFSRGDRGGIDVEMIQELCDALDHHYDEELNWISDQLQLLERYQDTTAYYMYPMEWKNGGVLHLFDFSSFGIQDALSQFEEDFEYEKWLNDKEHINAIKDYNRHLFLSCADFEQRDGWVGELSSERGELQQRVDVGEYLVSERYTMDVRVVNHAPNPKGYGKGTTEYGDVYIPAKFNKYLPPIGETSMMTLVPQVFDSESKCIPWKCIFQHDGIYH